MNIENQNGVISTITFSPFNETNEYKTLRQTLFDNTSSQSNIIPTNHINSFDESILTFDNLQEALDFLITFQRNVNLKSSSSNLNFSIKSSLCTGNYFIHQDQIYGEAVNLATRLSNSARKNEIILCYSDKKLLKNLINHQDSTTWYERSDEDNCICIQVNDEEITRILDSQTALLIDFNGKQKIFDSTRNLRIKIGRSNDADIIIDSDRISRNHATIKMNYNTVTLVDHSSNGTYVYKEGTEVFLSDSDVKLSNSGLISCGEARYSGSKENTNIISFEFDEITRTVY